MEDKNSVFYFPKEIPHPLNENVMVSVDKIFRKNHVNYVMKTQVKDLDVAKCSKLFLDLKLNSEEYVYIKCSLMGTLDMRPTKNGKMYRIIPYNDYNDQNPCLKFEYYGEDGKLHFTPKKKYETLDDAIEACQRQNL